MTLRDLLERVERATGPDRELDAAICRLTGYTSEQPDGSWLDTFKGGYRHTLNPPALTASVDADLALIGAVLPGWRIELLFVDGAWVGRLGPDDLSKAFWSKMLSPALALCAALLAAMIEQEGA